MKPSAISNSLNTVPAKQFVKTVTETTKKAYTKPTSTVIELPDCPKLLATGRWYPTPTQNIPVDPKYRVFEV